MKFLAAAVQMLASSDKAANLDEARRWVRAAASKGARVIALPEVFIWRGSKSDERKSAEPIPGPASQELAGLARELGIYLLGGSILEEIPGSDKAYNTSLLFGPQGNLLASYRKIHLFDVDLAQGISVRESDTRAFGNAIVVAATELCPMGLTVCYDLRFPELYRGLTSQGAQLIFVPSAFTAYTGQSTLGAATARASDRKSSLHHRAGSVREKHEELRDLRPFNDRRSMGKNLGRTSGRPGLYHSRNRSRLSRQGTRGTTRAHTP